MTEDEAVKRLKAAWQEERGCPPFDGDGTIARSHPVAIRALMDADKPLPVDPDLLLARKIVADDYNRDGCFLAAADTRGGRNDKGFSVRTTLAGIKAGKATR